MSTSPWENMTIPLWLTNEPCGLTEHTFHTEINHHASVKSRKHIDQVYSGIQISDRMFKKWGGFAIKPPARCCLIGTPLLFMCLHVPAGERRRKAVCVRKSDHLEVSDQRCERLPRPVAVAEPCNTDCELRCALITHAHTN